MSDNNDQTVKVELTPSSRFYDMMISDVMTFVTFSALFLGMNLGWFGENAAFTLGVLQLCLVGLFFVGARERAKYNQFWGNANFIFVFFFGVLGGVTNILTGLGIPLCGEILAVPNLLCGGLMLCTIRGVKDDPWTFALLWVLAAVAVFGLGLAGVGILAKPLSVIAGLCLGGVALLGFWAMISTMLGYVGVNVSLGKPFGKK